jgi:hypothetical protein
MGDSTKIPHFPLYRVLSNYIDGSEWFNTFPFWYQHHCSAVTIHHHHCVMEAVSNGLRTRFISYLCWMMKESYHRCCILPTCIAREIIVRRSFWLDRDYSRNFEQGQAQSEPDHQ